MNKKRLIDTSLKFVSSRLLLVLPRSGVTNSKGTFPRPKGRGYSMFSWRISRSWR